MATKKPLDAIQLLTNDHKEVKSRFKNYQKLVDAEAGPDERRALAAEVCLLLIVHAQIEEEIFYPAARKALGKQNQDLLDEAEVEHASAKQLMAEIADMRPDHKLYDAKVIVLGEYVDHHVKEEQDEIFVKLRKTAIDLAALGEQLAARKQELMAEAREDVS